MKKEEKSQLNRDYWLYIDTSNPIAQIRLYDRNNHLVGEGAILETQTLSSELLCSINLLLKKNLLSLRNLKYISVFPGPGSYTGLRIGVSTANLLALTLNIPIFSDKSSSNHQNFAKPVLPVYAAPPHITKPKSRLK